VTASKQILIMHGDAAAWPLWSASWKWLILEVYYAYSSLLRKAWNPLFPLKIASFLERSYKAWIYHRGARCICRKKKLVTLATAMPQQLEPQHFCGGSWHNREHPLKAPCCVLSLGSSHNVFIPWYWCLQYNCWRQENVSDPSFALPPSSACSSFPSFLSHGIWSLVEGNCIRGTKKIKHQKIF